ncbi:MAG: LytTR family transcriptional regulator DNA-binding domain-containing protein [Lachnospiraceae bacterium]|nr:LytTR family transcriptional regulator DNA-binding domain-containing protein [Lachnospiraceae bacterium]
MLIKTEINEKYKEMELHVCNETMNDNVREVVRELHSYYDEVIYGTDERGNRRALSIGSVISFYSEGQRVMALNKEGAFNIQKKLYELEESLSDTVFTRISKSEIINIGQIAKLDMNMTGTIRIIMKNGYTTFASRRNVAKLKNILVKNR